MRISQILLLFSKLRMLGKLFKNFTPLKSGEHFLGLLSLRKTEKTGYLEGHEIFYRNLERGDNTH
jgi:hypothetical protein